MVGVDRGDGFEVIYCLFSFDKKHKLTLKAPLPKDNPEGYAEGSNPAAAKNLKGKLLIMHGTADVNAPFSTTMRMVDALIREKKLHDLAVLPQADHYFRGHYGRYATKLAVSYFKEHLAAR